MKAFVSASPGCSEAGPRKRAWRQAGAKATGKDAGGFEGMEGSTDDDPHGKTLRDGSPPERTLRSCQKRRGKEGRSLRTRLFPLVFLLLLFGLLLIERWENLQEINRGLGALLVGLGVELFVRARSPLPLELRLALTFLSWSTLSGWLMADHAYAVTAYARLLLQSLALAITVFLWTSRRASATLVFVGLVLCGGVLLLGEVLIGGGISGPSVGYYRATSLVKNPNFAGLIALYAVMSVAWLWYRYRAKALAGWVGLGALVPLVSFLVSTASRKAFLSLLLFGVLWFVLAGRRLIKRRAIALAFAATVLSLAVFRFLPGSTLEARLDKSRENPDVETSRRELYEIAWDLFAANPIAGVGLGNFLYASGTGYYSHSDYAEVLSTTGAVGGLFYFGIYAVLWRRLSRVVRRGSAGETRYYVGVYRAMILTTLAFGLGAPNFLSPWHWVLMFGIAGHAHAMESAQRARHGPGAMARRRADGWVLVERGGRHFRSSSSRGCVPQNGLEPDKKGQPPRMDLTGLREGAFG